MPPADLSERLVATFAWRSDRGEERWWADVTGWWRDPVLLRDLGAALAGLFADATPTVVLGLPSRGVLLGALVARALGVGLVEGRKDPNPAADSDQWLTAATLPDHRNRVLLVDDWVATGGQALGAQRSVGAAGATWLGAVVVVDALVDHRTRRALGVRSLLHERDLR